MRHVYFCQSCGQHAGSPEAITIAALSSCPHCRAPLTGKEMGFPMVNAIGTLTMDKPDAQTVETLRTMPLTRRKLPAKTILHGVVWGIFGILMLALFTFAFFSMTQQNQAEPGKNPWWYYIFIVAFGVLGGGAGLFYLYDALSPRRYKTCEAYIRDLILPGVERTGHLGANKPQRLYDRLLKALPVDYPAPSLPAFLESQGAVMRAPDALREDTLDVIRKTNGEFAATLNVNFPGHAREFINFAAVPKDEYDGLCSVTFTVQMLDSRTRMNGNTAEALSLTSILFMGQFYFVRNGKYYLPASPLPTLTCPSSVAAVDAMANARENEPAQAPAEPQPAPADPPDRGLPLDTADKASAYWVGRIQQKEKEPYVLFTFADGDAARRALLALPCIHESATGGLICDEILYYGHYYQAEPGIWEAFIGGRSLSHALWQAAMDAFAAAGGTLKNQLEPALDAVSSKLSGGDASRVTFVREDRDESATWRVHRAESKADAMAFLDQNPVTQGLYYLVVETPEGTIGRDKDGIYQE